MGHVRAASIVAACRVSVAVAALLHRVCLQVRQLIAESIDKANGTVAAAVAQLDTPHRNKNTIYRPLTVTPTHARPRCCLDLCFKTLT